MKKGLTRREKQVLECVIEGNSNKMIALSLGISESTVKNHMTNAMTKLGARNRAQAAILYIRTKRVSLLSWIWNCLCSQRIKHKHSI